MKASKCCSRWHHTSNVACTGMPPAFCWSCQAEKQVAPGRVCPPSLPLAVYVVLNDSHQESCLRTPACTAVPPVAICLVAAFEHCIESCAMDLITEMEGPVNDADNSALHKCKVSSSIELQLMAAPFAVLN